LCGFLAIPGLPNETFRIEVTDVLVAKFWRLEDLCSRLEVPGTRIYDLLLRPPPGQACWADRLGEAIEQIDAELVAQW
jgi:hypothetical protein